MGGKMAKICLLNGGAVWQAVAKRELGAVWHVWQPFGSVWQPFGKPFSVVRIPRLAFGTHYISVCAKRGTQRLSPCRLPPHFSSLEEA